MMSPSASGSRRLSRLPFPLLASLLASLWLLGCQEPPGNDVPPPCDCAVGQPVVDPALLAFLSKAKAIHIEADIAEGEGDVPRAISLLEQLLTGPVPGGSAPPPEAREVMSDTLARQAELLSGEGDLDRATAAIERGLDLARERTHYRGRLMEVLGMIEQRRHDRLVEAGDDKGAEAAKARAIKALEEAVAIQDEVIRRTLGDGGASDVEPTVP